MPRLKLQYMQEVVPTLMAELGLKNPMQVPRLEKIVLNIGLGEATENPKSIESATKDLAAISGLHPVVTKAKKSIATFKLRKGVSIGAMVTLRGQRMFEFLDKLINVTLPRIRDFQGAPATSFDGRGNYTIGIKEQIIFPEIDYSQVDKIRGLQVSVVTSARSNEGAKRLLQLLGVPFGK
ncbi:MAG: 50S ribosomal protein L5 [Chloroflexi bacterium]|nr:50S ribosomal protein L5 [Chloroflexota bacterium]